MSAQVYIQNQYTQQVQLHETAMECNQICTIQNGNQ